VKILSVSDIEIGFIYSPQILERFRDTDLIISCGDLSYYYLEYMLSVLNVPLYHVLGNHAHPVEHSLEGSREYPWGAIDLHHRSFSYRGLLMAGLQGSVRYNNGLYQFTQAEMWNLVWTLTPALFLNRLRFGRYLDLFVTHAPPWGVHDMQDLPHQGFKAFRWLIRVFKPAYQLHGHIHVYRSDTIKETLVDQTRVINTYGYRETQIDMAELQARTQLPLKTNVH
jgi:uncharacterized protein